MTDTIAAPHSAPAPHAAHAHGAEHNALAHVASKTSLLATFGALLVLTVLTVSIASHGLGGSVDLWIAMIIATIKATIVGLYFMHLRHEKLFNTIIFLAAFLFVTVFIGFAMMDTQQLIGTVDWHDTLTPQVVVPAVGAK